jgi:dipeptidyl aminopeptidase/acylaminoacyl peptidase
MNSLHRARTPTLIAHGADDQRVHLSASIILWRALTDLGVETELLVFPDEPHGFEDPVHVTHLLEQWGAWYDRHLNTPVAAVPRP